MILEVIITIFSRPDIFKVWSAISFASWITDNFVLILIIKKHWMIKVKNQRIVKL